MGRCGFRDGGDGEMEVHVKLEEECMAIGERTSPSHEACLGNVDCSDTAYALSANNYAVSRILQSAGHKRVTDGSVT